MTRRVAVALMLCGGAAIDSARADGDVAALVRDLRGVDVGVAVDAAHRLGEDASPRALDAILDELSIGAPPRVQAALLADLATRPDPRAVPVLALYAHNRSPELRKKAIVDLSTIADPRVAPLLVAALSDDVHDVRAAAARGLAKRKEASALEPLVRLLERADNAAPDALAAVATPDIARRLAELINHVPDALLAQTLGGMLHRADFGPDPIRVDVVETLAKIPGADATAELKDYVTLTAAAQSLPSRVAAMKRLKDRGGG